MAADTKKTETPAAPVKPSIDDALKILFSQFTPAQIKAALEGADAPVGPPPLDPKYKGTLTYRLTEPHYRLGRMYSAGELITVTDEKPGKSWVPYEGEVAVVPVAAALPPAGRASDKEI